MSRKNLKSVWEELTAPPKPRQPLEYYQDLVYNTIEDAMKKRHVSVQFDLDRLEHVKDLMAWLRGAHNLSACIETVDRGCNPSTHDPWMVKVMTVKWT